MLAYRYRTATLLGPWRETPEAAEEDAIRAKQARRNEGDAGCHWIVPGAIEEAGRETGEDSLSCNERTIVAGTWGGRNRRTGHPY